MYPDHNSTAPDLTIGREDGSDINEKGMTYTRVYVLCTRSTTSSGATSACKPKLRRRALKSVDVQRMYDEGSPKG